MVARFVRDEEVASSNLVTPTNVVLRDIVPLCTCDSLLIWCTVLQNIVGRKS